MSVFEDMASGLTKSDVSREEIRNTFIETFDNYTHLFQTYISRTAESLPGYDSSTKRPLLLGPERAYYVHSTPPIFYFGHTAAIYIQNMVAEELLTNNDWNNSKVDFKVLIGNVMQYVKDEGNWNTVDEIEKFRSSVKEIVLKVMDNFPIRIHKGHPSLAILRGVEYESKYIEIVYSVIRSLPLDLVNINPYLRINPSHPDTNPLIHVPEQRLIVREPSWTVSNTTLDNKATNQFVNVPAFTVTRNYVSNKEYLLYVESGNYAHRNQFPKWWRYNNGKWTLRLPDREIDMPWEWPVELSHVEVESFLQWKSSSKPEYIYRLLTDDEWHSLYHNALQNENNDVKADTKATQNITIADMICNKWNWRNSESIHTYGYTSIPCLDNPRYKIQCGSWVSNVGIESNIDINTFYVDQVAGFRYVVECSKQQTYQYPEDKEERINSHYTNADEVEDNYLLVFGNKQRIAVHNKMVQFVQMHNLPKGAFVDIGGGSGDTMIQIYQECQNESFKSHHVNRQFCVVEPSAEYLSQMKNPNIVAINKGANEWTEEMISSSGNASFILCKEVIHHLNESFLDNMSSILVDHGCFLIITRPKYNVGFPFGSNGHRTWIASYGDSMDIESVGKYIKNMGCFEISRSEYTYSIKVKKEDWLRLNSTSPIFSNIAVLSESERMEDVKELQERYRDDNEIEFNDTLILFQAVKRK